MGNPQVEVKGNVVIVKIGKSVVEVVVHEQTFEAADVSCDGKLVASLYGDMWHVETAGWQR
jgi:hypothetical protein